MQANPDHRFGGPAMQRVIVRHIPEPSAQRLLLEKGDIDIARNLSPDQIEAIAGNPEILVEAYPKADIHYLGLNQKDERLAKPEVRQALRWLVDYQGMADSFLRGQYKVHQAFWPSGFFASSTPRRRRRCSSRPAIPTASRSSWMRPTHRPGTTSRRRSRRPWPRAA
jgi:peptide/nickel transport system substrate-binding protein